MSKAIPTFSIPVAHDAFMMRSRQARQMLLSAGMGQQIGKVTRDAKDFAGADHDAYIAYVAWKIAAHKAGNRGK